MILSDRSEKPGEFKIINVPISESPYQKTVVAEILDGPFFVDRQGF
jgi:hypothetical protein